MVQLNRLCLCSVNRIRTSQDKTEGLRRKRLGPLAFLAQKQSQTKAKKNQVSIKLFEPKQQLLGVFGLCWIVVIKTMRLAVRQTQGEIRKPGLQ
jgi:hypothetical protein